MNAIPCHPDRVDDYERLGRRVKRERVLRFRTVDAAREGTGMSRGAWDNVEHGRPAKDLTYNRIEVRLGWELGDCRRILEGGEPSPGRPTAPAGIEQDTYRKVREVLDDARARGVLTDDEQVAVLRRIERDVG